MTDGKYLDGDDVAKRLGMTLEELAASNLKPAATVGETAIFKTDDVATFEEARDAEATSSGGLYLTRAQVKIELGLSAAQLADLAKRHSGGLRPADRRGDVELFLRAAVLAFKAKRGDGPPGETPKPSYLSEAEAARALGMPLSEFRKAVVAGQTLRPSHRDPATDIPMFAAGIVAAMAEARAGRGGPASRGPARIELVGEREAAEISGVAVEVLRAQVTGGRLKCYFRNPDGSLVFSKGHMTQLAKRGNVA